MKNGLGDLINSKNSHIIEPLFQKYPILRKKYKWVLRDAFEFKEKFSPYNRTKINSRNWDYLIILDACRFDYFKKYHRFERGDLTKILSAGSHTSEWLINNFKDENYSDTVYISGNPQISNFMLKKRIDQNPFFKIDNVWDYGWSEEHNTVLPGTITKSTMKSIRNHPEKKHIIHYIQPHVPFIKDKNLRKDGISPLADRSKEKGEKIWVDVRRGKVSIENLKRAYKNNLIAVFPAVEKLIDNLEGKIIITSDHGQLFGEYFLFSHPSKIYFKKLIVVPWLEINK